MFLQKCRNIFFTEEDTHVWVCYNESQMRGGFYD